MRSGQTGGTISRNVEVGLTAAFLDLALINLIVTPSPTHLSGLEMVILFDSILNGHARIPNAVLLMRTALMTRGG